MISRHKDKPEAHPKVITLPSGRKGVITDGLTPDEVNFEEGLAPLSRIDGSLIALLVMFFGAVVLSIGVGGYCQSAFAGLIAFGAVALVVGFFMALNT